jgi:hypothetical protein
MNSKRKVPPPPSDSSRGESAGTGRVKFDDRGNAVWEWAVSTGEFGRDVSTQRLKKLESKDLAIADENPSRSIKDNPLGAVSGYNPYDSGQLSKTGEHRKKDLRKLGEWLQSRKNVDAKKPR